MRFIRSTHRLSLAVVFTTALCLALIMLASPGLTAEPHHHPSLMAETEKGYLRKIETYEIPPTTLLRADGTRTSLGDVLDRDQAVMLNFIFTTCKAVCPIMTGTFAAVQKKLGDDRDRVQLISISIDPEHDRPDKLLNYSRKYNTGTNWQFFTGNLPDIIALQKAFDAYRGNKMNHVPTTYLRTSREAPWVRIEGFANASELIEEYHRLLAP